MSTFLNDIKFAIRQLRKRPGFTVSAVLTLALGLSVNALIFSAASEFYLRPLPVPHSEDLVVIAQKSPQIQFAYMLSYPDFQDYRKAVENTESDTTGMARTFSGIMAYSERAVHLSRTNEVTERSWIHATSNNYFSVLGVQPQVGRLFYPSEGLHDGEEPIIVLTHDFWQRRFGGNPDIVGQMVKLNGVPFTVVGITPPKFHGAAYGFEINGFIPATMVSKIEPGSRLYSARGNTTVFLMARLRSGVPFKQARKVASQFHAQLVQEYPDNHAKKVKAQIMRERLSRPSPHVANFTPFIVTTLMILALLVLVVAIANVANLLFARAAQQQLEIAIRSALGASRWRLLRQLLVESVLLALGAGVVGIGLMHIVSPYIDSMTPSPTAPSAELGVDWRLFVFTFLASLVAGLFTGILPALRATNFYILPILKEGTRSVMGTRHPWRSLLVTSQVAISVIVLVCAGLAVRSLQQLSHAPLGYRSSNLLLASFDLGMQRYDREQGVNFYTQLLQQVRTLPSVANVTLTAHVPLGIGGGMRGDIHAEGREPTENERFEFIPCISVERTFMQAMDVTLLEGRTFRPQDNQETTRVAIINRVLADHLWPDETALGRKLMIGNRPHEVVGITGACRYWSITDRNRPIVFRPLAQNYRDSLTLLVHTAGPASPLRSSIEQIVRRLDPDLPLYHVQTIEQHIASSPMGLMPMRMGATVAGIQGILALLLAALGITGLVSFAVTERTREIGIRMALGAQTRNILQLVTRQSLKLAVIGLILGLAAALGISQVLGGLLYGISSTDPMVFGGVVLIIISATLFACWIPARRAAKIDPMEALRYE